MNEYIDVFLIVYIQIYYTQNTILSTYINHIWYFYCHNSSCATYADAVTVTCTYTLRSFNLYSFHLHDVF